jgi:DNA primase
MKPLPPALLRVAKNLKPGHKARVDHDCGGGKTALLSHTGKGYSLHCFRCGEPGWSSAEPEPLSVRLERLSKAQAIDNVVCQDATLPEPQVRAWGDWPGEARLWFLKAGLSSHDAGQLGAYYHPGTQRVVLPVYSPAKRLLYWQARALDKRLPKYLGSPVGKQGCVPMWGKADAVTLTEDILSAYKVGTVAEGWCLLGTSMTKTCLGKLLERGAPVNVWLDPYGIDKAGTVAANKVSKQLKAVGLEVRIIKSLTDPKLVHRSQIKELLCKQGH